jgi:hypothetical protein
MAVGNAIQALGWLDTWGGKFTQAVDYTGPVLYVPGTGDGPLDPKIFGCPEALMFADGSMSQSGNYFVRLQPKQNGYGPWYVRWFVTSTGLEAGAINLSGETVKLWAFGV